MSSPREARSTLNRRHSSTRLLVIGSAAWVGCFAWWLICFFSDWSRTGWAFIAISGLAAALAGILGATLALRVRWAVALLWGALAAIATIAAVDFLTYEIGSNL